MLIFTKERLMSKSFWFPVFQRLILIRYHLQVSVSPEGKALVSRVERTGSRLERYLHNSEQSAPLENELIYLDDSPDYCKEDKINDIQSPRGRECSDKCETSVFLMLHPT